MAERIAVEVVYAESANARVVALEVPHGTTAMNALERSRLLDELPQWSPDTWRLGIFGRPVEPGQIVQAGDRIEVYRPLLADPKARRRARAGGC